MKIPLVLHQSFSFCRILCTNRIGGKPNLKGIYSEKMYDERRLLELLAASLQPEKQVLWEFLLYNIIV